MDMKESKAFWSRKRSRGQSIVEFAMMAPILLLLLSGLFEFGFLFINYLSVLDSARNAARFASDSQFDIRDSVMDCTSKDFYRQTACMAVQELTLEQPTIVLCLPGAPTSRTCPGAPAAHDWDKMDDVIISVFSVLRITSAGSVKEVKQFPRTVLDNPIDKGWSYAYDLIGYSQEDNVHRTGMHFSTFDTGKIISRLQDDTPNTGYVLVEINYNYHQMLALPWFEQIIDDPIKFHLYAIWPLVSAEPTSSHVPPTPIP